MLKGRFVFEKNLLKTGYYLRITNANYCENAREWKANQSGKLMINKKFVSLAPERLMKFVDMRQVKDL